MRTPLIAGNWKMHMNSSQAVEITSGLHYSLRDKMQADVVVAPPFTALYSVGQNLRDSFINLGAQNMHWEEKGAFTGEVSPEFLTDLDVEYVILGHSERREIFGETDQVINKKVLTAARHGLIPVLCVGESLQDQEQGITFKVIAHQLAKCLENFPIATQLVIAYEPIWAIGTGKTPTLKEIQEVHLVIRSFLGEVLNHELAARTRILYGGSVKPSNAKEILALEDVHGALVGGASLKVGDFCSIVNAL